MADKGKPRRRRKWLVPLLAAGAGAWFVRSRRGAQPDAWLPPLPAPAEEPASKHAAATPAEATLDPEPSVEAPKHAAEPGSTVNGAESVPVAAPVAESEPEAAEQAPSPAEPAPPNALFTDAPEKGVAPLADGSAPGPEFVIKGNVDSMLFHTLSSPYYGRTKAEIWFRTEEEATAAGFTKWTRRPSG